MVYVLFQPNMLIKHKNLLKKTESVFSMDGDLGNVDGFKLIFPEKDVKKEGFLDEKYNIGIIAKTATSKANIKKLNLRQDPSFDVKQNIWLSILREKYKIDYLNMLLSTDDKYLLEFSKSAKRDSDAGNFYNGLIEKNVLYGSNIMGKLLMYIREEIKNPKTEEQQESEGEPAIEETDFDVKKSSNSKNYDDGYDDGYKLYDEIYDNGYKDAESNIKDGIPDKIIKNL